MPTVLQNALLVDLATPNVELADLRIEDDCIVARGRVQSQPGDEIIDCGGAVVLPGMVNGHTHLYSALAVGMPAPTRVPRNFKEILELVWWRLDRALDEESNEMSATIGALDALRCGTTTLIDHHASPNAIDGSLDAIERGISTVGLRGVLCYEVTDRNGREGRDSGLSESRRYINKCAQQHNGRFAALAGAHASFTLNDDSLDQIAALNAPVHIHVAEDRCDTPQVIERLSRHALLKTNSIFAHGIHLDESEIARINSAGLTMAHNPRSNMNNAVGYMPIAKYKCPVMLGTDGIGGDMFTEARAAWFKSRDAGAGISPNDVTQMLAASARRASQALGVTIGSLQPDTAADVVVTDYIPFTPLDSSNVAGHLIFAMSSQNVRHVMVGGEWKLRDRAVISCDEQCIRRATVQVAKRLWERMAAIS